MCDTHFGVFFYRQNHHTCESWLPVKEKFRKRKPSLLWDPKYVKERPFLELLTSSHPSTTLLSMLLTCLEGKMNNTSIVLCPRFVRSSLILQRNPGSCYWWYESKG